MAELDSLLLIKRAGGDRQERARAELVFGAREGERLVLECFLLIKIALGDQSVFITCTRGQETAGPWKPELPRRQSPRQLMGEQPQCKLFGAFYPYTRNMCKGGVSFSYIYCIFIF